MKTVFISEENILFNASAADFEEAVRVAGGLLVANGSAKESYIDAMVEMAKTHKYIVLTNGVAMPHARPESGAIGNCLCLVKLENGVNFGHAEHDPVHLVFGLVALNEEEHIDVMESLAELLGEETNIEKLIQAPSKQELVNTILEMSQQRSIL